MQRQSVAHSTQHQFGGAHHHEQVTYRRVRARESGPGESRWGRTVGRSTAEASRGQGSSRQGTECRSFEASASYFGICVLLYRQKRPCHPCPDRCVTHVQIGHQRPLEPPLAADPASQHWATDTVTSGRYSSQSPHRTTLRFPLLSGSRVCVVTGGRWSVLSCVCRLGVDSTVTRANVLNVAHTHQRMSCCHCICRADSTAWPNTGRRQPTRATTQPLPGSHRFTCACWSSSLCQAPISQAVGRSPPCLLSPYPYPRRRPIPYRSWPARPLTPPGTAPARHPTARLLRLGLQLVTFGWHCRRQGGDHRGFCPSAACGRAAPLGTRRAGGIRGGSPREHRPEPIGSLFLCR